MNLPLARLNPAEITAEWRDGVLTLQARGEVAGVVPDARLRRVLSPEALAPAKHQTFEVVGHVNPLPFVAGPFMAEGYFEHAPVFTVVLLTPNGRRVVRVQGAPRETARAA